MEILPIIKPLLTIGIGQPVSSDELNKDIAKANNFARYLSGFK